MMDSYAALFRIRGTRRFVISGAVGRLPLSMTSLGIVLLVQARQDSYAIAGLVAAAYTLTAAVFSPLQGRLADQYGQRPVLIATALIYTAGIAGLLVSPTVAMSALAAAVAGTSAPQTGNFVRSRWTSILRDNRGRLSTAFALEAVLDEVVFIIGPVLVTWLTLSVAQASGLVTAAACAIVGGLTLAAQASTAPEHLRTTRGSREPFVLGILVPIVIAAVGLGANFGSMEVVAAAITQDQGSPELAGPLLAVWSVGSLIAGVITGARPAARRPVQLLRFGTVLLVASFVPMLFTANLGLLAAALFISGLTIAPTLITATTIIEQGTPASRVTEALTWTSTGVAIGIAPGAAAAGYLADNFSPSLAFSVPLVAATLTMAVAMAFPERRLREMIENR